MNADIWIAGAKRGVIILELPEYSESQGNRTGKQKATTEAQSKVE